MGSKNDRFERVYHQDTFATTMEIWVDRETGVQYLWRLSSYAGGLTPLLGPDGKPMVGFPSAQEQKER